MENEFPTTQGPLIAGNHHNWRAAALKPPLLVEQIVLGPQELRDKWKVGHPRLVYGNETAACNRAPCPRDPGSAPWPPPTGSGGVAG